MRLRPREVRVADVTIHGVKREKNPRAQTLAPRMRIGHEEGNEFSNGNVFIKSAIAKRLIPAKRKAERAQKRAGSPPATRLAWVTLQPATAKAKKAKERFTQWRRFLVYTRAPRPVFRMLTT